MFGVATGLEKELPGSSVSFLDPSEQTKVFMKHKGASHRAQILLSEKDQCLEM